ncbi:NucA/NucB deoxyribonuclease domain-containing protein [Streptomyces cyaneofuscatus]|uniref:NucA/NucB deoxyribonuclease domain-containing protein n=1 Tax=Streptomyces cyaneofuscatus TaxID=66883 RepID=UPI00341275B0
MRKRRNVRAGVAVLAVSAVLGGFVQGSAQAVPTPRDEQVATADASASPESVPPAERSAVLGGDYRKSGDVAWTTSGDAQGFHVMTARESEGYAWKTAASLTEPGFDADQWIGNACVTASGDHAVVVYAPRTFTNDVRLMARGGFTAVVELASGSVTKLPLMTSLSYYNPGCGADETAVLTQSMGEDKTGTRLTVLDTVTGRLSKPVVTEGQVTSAVPGAGKEIVAAFGSQIVSVDAKGTKKRLTRTSGTPYRITPDAHGGVVFLDRRARKDKTTEATTYVKRLAATATAGTPAVLGHGKLSATGLTRAGAQIFVTGQVAEDRVLPDGVTRLARSSKDAVVSTHGEAVVERTTWADGKGSPAALQPKSALEARRVDITTTVRDSGKQLRFTVVPTQRKSAQWQEGRRSNDRLRTRQSSGSAARSAVVAADATGSRSEVVESERVCSVPRNDPRNQALQPKPRQVEWAVDQAVIGGLDKHVSRPANWKNLGMPAYQPQTLFPNPVLEGGGRVPAQILLGITTQESNMWQAARSAVPGVTANPLIGNYYGIDLYDGNSGNDWDIDFAEADCGYGITQVTDHMRLAGREDGKGGAAWDYQKQRAVALDYTANIAGGLQILVDKWNTTKRAGLVVHDGDPKRLENWFFALWAYNSGFYENVNNNGPWGVGWANNPANPEWDAGRNPFMEDRLGNEDASAAARPQNWPYPEKVLGFAAHPPSFLESPGTLVGAFRPAWWNGTDEDATVKGSAKQHRAQVKPPEDTFCGPYNECDPAKISDSASNSSPTSGPCTRADSKCWWHQSVMWKTDCSYSCGNELMRFNNTYPEEPDGTAYPPTCTVEGLPQGSLIIDDLPQGTPVVRPGCSNSSWTNSGTFSFDFGDGDSPGTGGTNRWPAKVDLHQLGAGFGGHFYFGHGRKDDAKGQRLKISGTWKLNKKLDSAAKVYIHLPDHGAQDQNTYYEVRTNQGWERVGPISQPDAGKSGTNRWYPIGVWQFAGMEPEVRLTTLTLGDGDADVAFDAVAFAPGDYVDMPAVTFGDPDPNRPDIDFEKQDFKPVPTPPANFENLSSLTADRLPAVKQKAGATEAVEAKLSADGTEATFDSCPIYGTMYTRYTACYHSSRPLTFTVLVDNKPRSATFNVSHQIQLYPNETSFDEQITINPITIDPLLVDITLEWRTNCPGSCDSSPARWIGTPSWLATGDRHPVTAGIGHWWTGSGGTETIDLTTMLTAITPVGGATTTWGDHDLRIRCDRIMGDPAKPKTKAGCVFPGYTPTLTIDSKKRPAAAALYWVLMERLERHPGSEKHSSPLSRLADEKAADENRAKICDSTFIARPNGTSTKTSCDEYPFAKSRQSGGQSISSGKQCVNVYAERGSNGRWSLEYDTAFALPTWKEVCGRGNIPLGQNTAAGGDLGRFTTETRLHDYDEYYVKVSDATACSAVACNLP